ncbi:MAG: imidazoleglycerol-phosphate dehydratase [Acidilobaceae archaeon]
MMYSEPRKARVLRKTREVNIVVELNLDEPGYNIVSPYPMLTHLLEAMAHHGSLGLKVEASGDIQHHVIEDLGIALGEALDKALGNRIGIARFAHAIVPMDEALVLASLDLVRRPYVSISLGLRGSSIDGIDGGLIEHLLKSIALWGRFTLHVAKLRGKDVHHVAEASFKALGLSLKSASRIVSEVVPSTKGEV